MDINLKKKNTGLLDIFFIFTFISLVLFDMTVYKFIWGIESIARLFNFFTLISLLLFAFVSLTYQKESKPIWIFILIPGLLVFLSIFINITRGVMFDPSTISFYGGLLPMVALLASPFLIKHGALNSNNIFKYYYLAMLLIVSISLLEYLFVFLGFITPNLILTSGGPFMATNFSILFDLEDNIYNTTDFDIRFYAAIIENGSLAMLILPALIYSFFKKLKVGFLILLIGFFATQSLGGFLSLSLFLIMLPFLIIKNNKGGSNLNLLLFIVFYILIGVVMTALGIDYLQESYNNKFAATGGAVGPTSGSTRIDNITILFGNLPSILIDNPMGYTLNTNSNEVLGGDFYGLNVGLGVAIYKGGFLAFLGYIILSLTYLFISLKNFFRRNADIDSVIASSSIIVLFPFFLQRGAIFETSVLILLVTPFVIQSLKKST